MTDKCPKCNVELTIRHWFFGDVKHCKEHGVITDEQIQENNSHDDNKPR